MELVAEIRELAAANLSEDKFVVEVLIPGKKVPKRVMIIIDGDAGVTIDDCANLSRALSKEFEERAFFGDENYLLEVSTPGLDHPLKFKRQYHKNIGRILKVKLPDTLEEGTLTAVEEDKIVLTQETGKGKHREVRSVEVPFASIEKAFVMVSFK